MNIGDKVRMIHGREEGIVTRLLDNNLIEVEIEDGFLIPVLRKEVVVVDKAETTYFTKETNPTEERPAKNTKPKAAHRRGLFLAYKTINDKTFSLHLINTTPHTVLYSITELTKNEYRPVVGGQLASQEATKVKLLDSSAFEQWNVLNINALAHPGESVLELPARWQFRHKPKAATFYRNQQTAPLLEVKSHLFELPSVAEVTELNPQALIEKIQDGSPKPAGTLTPPTPEIDLHIQANAEEWSGRSATEIMEFQLATFEDTLSRAIASQMPEITYIHGIGNGRLKHEIHKRLSQHQHIAYFKDARKEKFGYGATLVRLKA